MMIDVGGDFVDGFHVESVPEFYTDEDYSADALGWQAGIKAVWLLYRRGRWEELGSLGVDVPALRNKLERFSHYEDQLTKGQVLWLRDKVPEIEAASFRLRALYALKYRIREAANENGRKTAATDRAHLSRGDRA